MAALCDWEEDGIFLSFVLKELASHSFEDDFFFF